ncbi:MAG: glycosyltransferase family 2 protein [Bacteroidota bacterium]
MDIRNNAIDPMVSVVMSVYNGDAYLKEAINSILNQTFTNFEFIIINDGSNDTSLSIIKSYSDKRIVLIDNIENKGLIYSLNKGFKIAKGKYIARMDADDISLPNRLFEQFNFLENHKEVGVVGCNYIQFNKHQEHEFHITNSHDEILGFMLFNASVIHPSLMMRKLVLDAQPLLFNLMYKHAEDYELWSRLIFATSFSNVKKTLFKYRLHEEQVTVMHSAEQVKSANLVRENILKKAGFVFSENELMIHCKIGSSELIKNFNDLVESEKWLSNLLIQNAKLKVIDESIFRKVISKQWIDTCGNTNLGLKAFFYYLKSNLSKKAQEDKLKHFFKCIIRKFKK